MHNKTREPLFHISKRDALPWYRAWAIRLIAILAALIVCAVITVLFTGQNPADVFFTIVKGAIGSPYKIKMLLRDLAFLLCISLAVTPAFKMRFWNIGAEGQVLISALVSAGCMLKLADKLPNGLLIVVVCVAGIAAGAIWGVIPAIFKAKWGTNETLFTLMMNYVAIQLIACMINVWVPNGSQVVGEINPNSQAGWLPIIAGEEFILPVIVVAVLTVLTHLYLNYSKHGYEIAVVGESERTARYIGIKVDRVIIRTMALSGALCGVAGVLLVAGTQHTVTTDLAGGQGFTAVMVSWLSGFHPLGMVLASLLLVFMNLGAGKVSQKLQLNKSFPDILTGIIIFFIIGCEFFLRYRITFRSHSKKEGGEQHV